MIADIQSDEVSQAIGRSDDGVLTLVVHRPGGTDGAVVDGKSARGWVWSTSPTDDLIVDVHADGRVIGASTVADHPADGVTRVRWSADLGDVDNSFEGPIEVIARDARAAVSIFAEGPTAGTDRSASGLLELPVDGQVVKGDVLVLRGWCLFPDTLTARVEMLIDGKPAGLARPYVERSDIAATRDERDAPVCGFEALIPVEHHGGSTMSCVCVEAIDVDGNRWRSETQRVSWVPIAPDAAGAERAEILMDRCRQTLDALPASHRRVIVFTHDLSYGGGQLWLSELLRQLIEFGGLDCEIVSIADGPLREVLEDWGLQVHVTAPWRTDTVDAYEGRVLELAMLLRARQAGAVLVNTLGIFPAIDAAHRAGVPSIWAIHESFDPAVFRAILSGPGGEHPHVKQRFETCLGLPRALVFEASQTADLFAAHSSSGQRFVVDYGVNVHEIDAYRSTIDRASLRTGLGIDADDVVVVVVGVFEGRKAQAAIAAAFDELARVHPRLQLVMVGAHATPYTAGVREQVARSGARDRIRLEPIASDIYHWYAAADVLLCASDIESLPRSILEAMAFELPVVSTDAFGIADLIDDGVTGWLTRPRDVRGLLGVLHLVLTLPDDQRRAIGANARAEVVRRSGELSYGRLFARALGAMVADPDSDLTTMLSRS